ncbi:hypothetical protein GUJ93_ZPchr0007g5621, partial [Zizania palustris]
MDAKAVVHWACEGARRWALGRGSGASTLGKAAAAGLGWRAPAKEKGRGSPM